ncbi:SDR family NAD(P)-dependent oxidoreductase [Pseudenhygromyxa sp. WMMC2535]|nr:SDR family NAD(P)-dependent oxidoreductase [Pseudenhygromyxa sp. WMMC2535]NVB37309.1 SDR family NAD(P)-dependent oxidoreductase [Pseudenhygromyxa sp. WMMC2535]
MDLRDDASVEQGVAQVLAKGPVDVLVNNAGSADQTPFLAQPVAARRSELELNYVGILRATRAVLPSMIARGSGSIVNVSSLLAAVATPTLANYAATKAAVEAFTHSLRGEVGPLGVRMTVFVAPHTQTEQGEQTEFRGVVSLPVDYVAGRLVRAIDRGAPRASGSPVYDLLLRLAAWSPRFMEGRILAGVKHKLALELAAPEVPS